MGVGGPGVGGLETCDQVAGPRGGGCPQAEGAVDVDPGVVLVGQRDRGGEVVERTRVHIAGLQREDRRLVGQRVGQSINADPPLIVGGHRFGFAETEVSQGKVDGVVAFLADQHTDPWRALQPAGLDVPPGTGEDGVATGRETGEVRHETAGDGAHRGALGQPEESGQPTFDRLAGGTVRGGHLAKSDVLVPGAREPVCGESHRVRAADDEAEEAG